jgi:phage tail-like protein
MTEAATSLRPAGLPWARLDARAGFPLSATLSRGLAGGGEIALGTPGQRAIADTELLGSFGGRRLPRGLAIASDGRIYLADPDGRVILTALASDGAAHRPDGAPAAWPFVPLWPARPLPPAPAPHDLEESAQNPPADPYTLVSPLALALAPNGDLVIVDAGRDGAGRVLVLTLPDARVRHVLPLVEPVAISFDERGRACIADAGARTIARFDSYWRREAGYPHATVPAIEGLAQLAHTRSASCTGSCAGACRCLAPVAQGPDLWILARGKLHALTAEGLLWSQGVLISNDDGALPAASLPAEIELLPPALELSPETGLSWRDPAYPARDPLPLPGLEIDRGGRLEGTRLALLARPRRVELPRSGVAQLLALDGEREGFTWDRVVLLASVPERTRLLVSTATTEARLEEAQAANLPDSAWSAPLAIGANEPPEVLIQSRSGRYLWLRIEMFGDGARTPRIHGIDVYGPRRSSLADLPVPFHEDPESSAFLDRFLGYFDVVFAEIVARHATSSALFEPAAVPRGPFLEWLASWFDITFLPEWPEATRRAMIAQAITMFRRRGTIAGLRQMVQWHTGLSEPMPAIIEHFRVTAPISVAGSPLTPSAPAHTFTIVLPAKAATDATSLERLQAVIAAAIPAHTRYELRLVEPGITIGRQSTPGVDMLVGSHGTGPLGALRLGADALFPAGRPQLVLVKDRGVSCSC